MSAIEHGQQRSLTKETLVRAIHNNELVLYYQPKVCLLRGKLIGAEALVRWSDGQGVLSPSEFLPIAEKSGLLHDLTLKLLDQLVGDLKQLRQSPKPVGVQTVPKAASPESTFSLSINVAPDDLASRTISNRIGELLTSGTIHSSELQVEITESAVMSHVDRVYDDLVRLKDMGIKILMDDFGTGYSSIDRLSQLPFDALKLDQGVVKRMGTSPQNLDVVRSAISMARELGMTSVAEGVESATAYHFLSAHGCEEVQGFYIARPMSVSDLNEYLQQSHQFEGSQIGRVHQAGQNLIRFRKRLVDASYCSRLGNGIVLPSLLDPALDTTVEESRLGLWYFGVGQELSSLDAFKAIEKPLIAIHQHAETFLQAIAREASFEEQQRQLMQIDSEIELLISLLHRLERQLLSKTCFAGFASTPALPAEV